MRRAYTSANNKYNMQYFKQVLVQWTCKVPRNDNTRWCHDQPVAGLNIRENSFPYKKIPSATAHKLNWRNMLLTSEHRSFVYLYMLNERCVLFLCKTQDIRLVWWVYTAAHKGFKMVSWSAGFSLNIQSNSRVKANYMVMALCKD